MKWGSVVIGWLMYLIGYWQGRIDGRNGWRWWEVRAPSGCPCPCHEVIQPGLVPCPNCEHSSRYDAGLEGR